MLPFLMIVLFLLSVFMVLVILVQRGRGGGLAGAFGSGGGSSSAFGTKTGDVFTTVTVAAFTIFMLLSIWASFEFKWKSTPTVPAATAVAPASPTTGAPLTLPTTNPATGTTTRADVEKPATMQAATVPAMTMPVAPTTAPATTTHP